LFADSKTENNSLKRPSIAQYVEKVIWIPSHVDILGNKVESGNVFKRTVENYCRNLAKTSNNKTMTTRLKHREQWLM
jgi:hypothetical protein